MDNLTIYPNRLEKFLLFLIVPFIPFGVFFLFHCADWMTFAMICLILIGMPGLLGTVIALHGRDRISFLPEGVLVKTCGKPERKIPWGKLPYGYYGHDSRNRPYVILSYWTLQDWERKKLIRDKVYDLIRKDGLMIPISCCVTREEEDRLLTLLESRVSFQNDRSERKMF